MLLRTPHLTGAGNDMGKVMWGRWSIVNRLVVLEAGPCVGSGARHVLDMPRIPTYLMFSVWLTTGLHIVRRPHYIV